MCNIHHNGGKRPNKRSIEKAATHLMTIYGSTTTLEVKKYLRAQGYTTLQYKVSRNMELLCVANAWGFQYNGTFRTYYAQAIPQAAAPVLLPVFSAN